MRACLPFSRLIPAPWGLWPVSKSRLQLAGRSWHYMFRVFSSRIALRVKPSYVLASESGGRATHTVIELSFHLESSVALVTRIRF